MTKPHISLGGGNGLRLLARPDNRYLPACTLAALYIYRQHGINPLALTKPFVSPPLHFIKKTLHPFSSLRSCHCAYISASVFSHLSPHSCCWNERERRQNEKGVLLLSVGKKEEGKWMILISGRPPSPSRLFHQRRRSCLHSLPPFRVLLNCTASPS